MNSSPPSRDNTESPIGSMLIVAVVSIVAVGVQAEHVVGADQALQRCGELAQHLVGGLVADRVVDELEVVDVEEQDRELGALALGAGEHLLDVLVEQAAVRQSGEPVLVGQRADLLVRLAEQAQRVVTRRRLRAAGLRSWP